MSRWSPKRLAWLLGAALALWVTTGCRRQDAPPAADRVLRISQRNEPATLDPRQATLPDEFFVIRALGEGLLTPNPNGGTPLPGVADKWETSADSLTYTFHLRPDARWSNGDPVTVQDFIASYREALLPSRAAPKAALFFPIKNARAFYEGKLRDIAEVGITASDAHTLSIHLAQPQADFLAMVASGPWIPSHRDNVGCLAIGPKNVSNLLSNGPFIITEWQPNQQISVRKNPYYRDAAAVRLDKIQFLAFDNRDSEERAFRAGQVDVTMDVPFTKLAGYRTAQPAVLHTVPLRETRYLALNTTRAPFTDPRVRRALSLALDRRALTDKVLQGGQVPAFSFIPPGLGGYQPAAGLTEDATEARRLLAAAGFPGGRGFPRLELATWVNNPLLEAIQQMWRRELGIEVALAQHEARTHLAALAAGSYDLALVPAIPDYDGASDLFTQLQAGNPANYPHWNDAEFDRLVAAAGRTESPDDRLATYRQAEARLLAELPLIPLYFNTQNFLLRPAVKNWRTDGLWTRFYVPLSLE